MHVMLLCHHLFTVWKYRDADCLCRPVERREKKPERLTVYAANSALSSVPFLMCIQM